MKIKAKKSFCGVLSMASGEVREYNNEAVLQDLLAAGYIEIDKETSESIKSTPKKRGAKTGEGK